MTAGQRIAVVVGGTGTAGAGMAAHLVKRGAFSRVVSVSRSPPALPVPGAHADLRADISDPSSVATALSSLGGAARRITHVFWFAEASKKAAMPAHPATLRAALRRADRTGAVRGVARMLPGRVRDALYTRLAADAGSDAGAPNDKWIAGFLDALDGAGAELESFTLSTGGKLYGMHLGPALWAGYSLPFDEDRSRCPGTMSYTVAEAAVREHASRRGFKCSFVRPGFIVGLPRSFPPGLQNLGLNIAVYASLLKAMGKPLAFPGCAAAYARKDSFATPARIAEVAAWAALDGPEGEAFNAVSAQGTPWEETWAAIARWFRMPPRGPADQVRGTSAVELLGGREAAEEAWARVRAGNPGMLDVPLGSLLNGFLDLSFVHPHDSEFSLEKLRAHGFAGAEGLPPPGEMWGSFLEEAVRARVVPAPA